MIATILDSRLKKLNFIKSEARCETIEKLHDLYSDEKFESKLNTDDFDSTFDIHQDTTTSLSSMFSNFILNALFSNNNNDDDSIEETNEVNDYLALQPLNHNCDPLNWWKNNLKRFPLLSKIARKYLSIPATSVPSERLFSDAGLYLTSRHNCLAPDIVDQLLFLKRNAALFPIFPPSD